MTTMTATKAEMIAATLADAGEPCEVTEIGKGNVKLYFGRGAALYGNADAILAELDKPARGRWLSDGLAGVVSQADPNAKRTVPAHVVDAMARYYGSTEAARDAWKSAAREAKRRGERVHVAECGRIGTISEDYYFNPAICYGSTHITQVGGYIHLA